MWTELLQTHGYWILAIGCLLEGEAVLVLAGFAAHRGLLDPAVVVCIAAVSGFAGDQFYFWVGRRHGAGWLERWPSIQRQSARVHRLVERWHEVLILGVRFAYGLRIAGPLLIGMSALPAWRFALFNAIGAVLWALVFTAVGWMFGAAVETLLGELRHLEGWLFLALGLVLGVWALARRRIARRRGVG